MSKRSSKVPAMSTPTSIKRETTLEPKQSIKSTSTSTSSLTLCQSVHNYWASATTKVKLMDTFMAFLVVLGVLQFIFCVLVGNFPFNAFLGGFSSTVGQFVLTACLRIQTSPSNVQQFPQVSPERSLGDFIVGSLILHFAVYHFIN
ncbi:defender against cell death 1 [Nadsonia fulvescens var. elongata DSM 6958]|uniref:Dolichyl-diphosphooligosaccharide--protein glycosyltransferase subunit OST2 n=1 Tax=Nadsonia fulvescens var. elongata DSM 6958 TaxID=857566 RepID=A0A1E3PNK2_9ASCO|nr:defender against cell death 1 [Nadsonia fulvescens var. elongata DSM 6958]